MRIVLEKENNINVISLPEVPSGNYWLLDENSKNLLNIVAENNAWTLKSNADIKLISKEMNNNINEAVFIESEVLTIDNN